MTDNDHDARRRALRAKNLTVAGLLIAAVVLFYVVFIARASGIS